MENFKPSTFAENNVEFEMEKIKKLQELILKKLDRFMNLCVAGSLGDDYFSLDAASYYSLINLDNQRQELIKLGWGEMSKETFLAPKDELIYPESGSLIREIPLPIYCLTQQDSYFAKDGDLQIMKSNPAAYLKEKAVFVYDKMGVGFVGNEPVNDQEKHFKRRLPIKDLPAIDINEAISRLELFDVDK